jgi:predicted SPOUT superfamily RNA methylase MTH1
MLPKTFNTTRELQTRPLAGSKRMKQKIIPKQQEKDRAHTNLPINESRTAHKKLAVAIPASVTSDTPHLREKTSKIGLIGRAAAIFRVEEIVIYSDEPTKNQTREVDLITKLLTYMETPQYLRKRLFKLEPTLNYAGILPPLRTPHHPLKRIIKELKLSEYREAVTLGSTAEGTLADIGVERPALIRNQKLPASQRVTVRIDKINREVEASLTTRNETHQYWGYKVTPEAALFGDVVKKRHFDLTIATSRYGVPISDLQKTLTQKWADAKQMLVAFGSPASGLHEIAKREGLRLEDAVDCVVNMIPHQATETVRTEEALIASLAVLNACV